MLIQIHTLQNYAPSNLNRDDTGAPKDAIFGGLRRGRISSQCLKRAIRLSDAFQLNVEADLLAVRTKTLPSLVREQLTDLGVEEAESDQIISAIPEIVRGSSKDTSPRKKADDEDNTECRTLQLVFIAPNEIPTFSRRLHQVYQEVGKKDWGKISTKPVKTSVLRKLGSSIPRSVDVAMFGRMTTSSAFEDVQAAVQVAHALSTNALTQEFDYYTAVDDLTNEVGASMIGDIEFNSSTYYKYINVHWDGLVHNLGGDTAVAAQAVVALLEAAVKAQPSGKQNTFAAQNLPDLVLVEVRDENLPVSYTNAFLKPVRPGHDGTTLMEASIRALGDYMERISGVYDLDGDRAMVSTEEQDLPSAERLGSLRQMQGWLAERLG